MMIKFQIPKSKIQNYLRNRKAYVTITVLILMLVLVAITYLFADAIYAELGIARNNKRSQTAFSLAEAGVQEAIYKVQYDEATRNAFLNSTVNDIPSFSHDPALITNGSYSVTFVNTVKGAATVTSIGYYTMGLRTAQRTIKVDIAQSSSPPPYNDDEAIYLSAAENPEDLEIDDAVVNVYNGGIASAKKIDIEDSLVNVEKDITTSQMPDSYDVDKDSTVNCNCQMNYDPLNPLPACSSNPGCSVIHSPSELPSIPSVDFEWYKANADYYFEDDEDFYDFVPTGNSTLNGIVYVDENLTIEDRNIIINGILVSSKGIYIEDTGNLTISKVGSEPSGILAVEKFKKQERAGLSGTGIIWAGKEVYLCIKYGPTIEFTGGIFSRKIDIKEGTLNLHFDLDAINDPLIYNGDTPVIELNHWEEEY